MLLFFADDLSYYWFHRISHESRFFWASHVVHHSSQHYNLSTALRQTWVPMTALPFWLWLPAVGFEPWMVLLAQSWSLIYQFWIHTERVRKLPRPLEWVLNTPSHHRVHHGANEVLPGPQLRGHSDHLGPHLRHLRARGRARPLRPHPQHPDLQARSASPSTSTSRCGTTCRRAKGVATSSGVVFRGPGWSPEGVEASEGTRG